ncbi:hypothetical protein Hanom_Chr05g00441861 [Helianthus anomalus]
MFIVLDVKDMVLSEMYPPFAIAYHLGTVNGSFCTLHKQYDRSDMWVMKEQNQWSKIYSFRLPLSVEEFLWGAISHRISLSTTRC